MRALETVAVPSAHRARAHVARHAAFVGLIIAAVAWFWGPLSTVIGMSLQYGEYEHYSHIVAIPFLTLFLVYQDRRGVFERIEWAPRLGGVVVAGAVAASAAASVAKVGSEIGWSIAMLSLVAACLGIFVLCYGTQAFAKAAYPLLMLLLMVPLPPAVLKAIIGFLQRGSAEASAVIFSLIGVPLYREGFVFSLPRLTIEIAEECSGIRSSLALFIMSLVAGHMFLRSGWSKLTLAVVAIPLAIVKNAVRIVALSLLAIYVDPSFITGSVVHRTSGIPVFMMSFAIVGAIVWLLQKAEARLAPR